MQPYFFPYLGYYALIANTDRWVVFDTVQYTPKSWMNRNRILHPKEGWQYITVPLKNSSQSIRICEARVKDFGATRERILGQLDHYRKKAPHFQQVRTLVEQAFAASKSDLLRDLSMESLRVVCEYLGVPFRSEVSSIEKYALPAGLGPGQWALEISAVLGAREYINPPGGVALFDDAAFRTRGIELKFLTLPKFAYECGPYEFVEHLSILDVLMWNSPEAVRGVLREPTQIANC